VKKNIHMVRPVKDKLGLKVAGIYCVPCECGKEYLGQMGRTTETRCKEHVWHICLGQPEKLSVAEHKFETGHNIKFGNTIILDKAPRYVDHLIKQVTEIRLHPRNFARDRGFSYQLVLVPSN
jgi:hypothetical protein